MNNITQFIFLNEGKHYTKWAKTSFLAQGTKGSVAMHAQSSCCKNNDTIQQTETTKIS